MGVHRACVIMCRLFDFRRVPPVAGRYLNMNSEIRPFASRQLNKTFFISPGMFRIVKPLPLTGGALSDAFV